MQITATFTADNDFFLADPAAAINMMFIRAAEAAIKDLNVPSRNGDTHAYPLRDSNGNAVGAVTVHHG